MYTDILLAVIVDILRHDMFFLVSASIINLLDKRRHVYNILSVGLVKNSDTTTIFFIKLRLVYKN